MNTTYTPATTQQVRARYEDQGYEVNIDNEGRVEFRKDGGEWLDGRWVEEYRVNDVGFVFLQ